MVLRFLFPVYLAFGWAAGHGAEDSVVTRHRRLILESWRARVEENGGVHAWTPQHAGLRVFQEWAALLTLARDSGAAARDRLGKFLEHYAADGRIRPLGHPGTTLPGPGREGDFDMAAMNAVSLVELFQGDRLRLTDRAYSWLIREVIGTFGEIPQADFNVAFLRFPETENHLFMMESSRFLMNELLRDNPRGLADISRLRDSLGRRPPASLGGQRVFLLRRMQDVLLRGFFEFNAKVYQRFTAQALDNLFSFARDSAVAAGAGCVLDYLSVTFALQSLASIRHGPYRRSSETYGDPRLADRDPLCSFFAVQTGIHPWDPDPRRGFWRRNDAHASTALYSLLLRYRVPALLLDWMRSRPGEYEAVFRSGHFGRGENAPVTERYTGGPTYLLSAGGRHESYAGANFPTLAHWPRGPWVYDAMAVPGSLILYPPPEKLELEEDLIRTRTGWDGDQLALHRRFLFAYAPARSYESREWPFAVPAGSCPDSTRYEMPAFWFRFCDQSARGVFLVFSKVRPRGAWPWAYGRFVRGGLEVVPASEAISLRRLIAGMLEKNGADSTSPHSAVYQAWDGSRLVLNAHYRSGKPGFLAAADPESSALLPDSGWPGSWGGEALVQARLLSPRSAWLAAVENGKLRFRNPETGQMLEDDFREWWRPVRSSPHP